MRALKIFLAAALFTGVMAPLWAQSWGFSTVANISATMGVNDGRVCVGEGSRQDIGCPTYAPSVNSSGLFTATSIATGGLTVTGATSLSTVSATVGAFNSLTVGGVPITGGGGATRLASLTDVSLSNLTGLDILRYNGTSWTNVNVQNAISTTTMIANVPDQIFCNGGGVIRGMSIYSSDGTTVTYTHNGLSNYTITYNIATGAYVTNSNAGTYDCVTNAWSIGQLYAAGRAFNFIGGSGTVTPTVDRIISGTSNAIVNSVTGVISFTQLGVATAYLHPTLGLVAPGVSSTGSVSATSIYAGTAIQLASPTVVTACNAGTAGSLRYNSANTTLELCTGSGWQPMGVGIPAGTISAFASTTCPVGWSEYTPARGRFLRGIDNGAGNDPAGTRAPGNVQADGIKTHWLNEYMFNGPANYAGAGYRPVADKDNFGATGSTTNYTSNQTVQYIGEAETRPKNVAVTYCQFNGTSNGWNNPLSGGSTTPGGSTGAVQYNTSGSFDGSGNFTWTNASSLLSITGTLSATNVYGLSISGSTGFFPNATITVLSAGTIAANSLSSTLVSATNISGTNISATRLTVNGVDITGGGNADRIISGTSNAIVNSATGVISFTQLGTATAYLHPTLGLVAPGISTTGRISATTIYAGGALQLASPTVVTACNASSAGTLRYNSPTTTIELCTGSGWQPMGVGIPAGTISAFASTTCPTGWSEYTSARGRFLRGIDNGAGNDPAGTRAPGNTQLDAFQGHQFAKSDAQGGGMAVLDINYNGTGVTDGLFTGAPVTLGTYGTPRIDVETRPKNVAVIFCQFNGTSNGWNNPLSGGSTVPGGSTGAVQYNTSGSFDGSGNFTWTNASSLLNINGTLSATNISATRLTVNGVDITGGGNADRIISGTSNAIVNSATGVISFTQLGTATAYLHPTFGLIAPGLSSTGWVSASNMYVSNRITITRNPSTLPPPIASGGGSDATAHFAANDASITNVMLDSFGANGLIAFRRSNGTAAAPTALTSGSVIGRIGALGYGTTAYTTNNRAAIAIRAAEDWTDTAQATLIDFTTTGPSASTAVVRMTLASSGALGIGTAVPAASLTVIGEVQVSNSGVTCSGTTAGAIRYSGAAMSFCNGSAWTALGGSGTASPTNVPAFFVHRNGTNQTVTSGALTAMDWTTEVFDATNAFDTSTDRFTPNVAGRYLLSGSVYCTNSTSYCQIAISKNGVTMAAPFTVGSATVGQGTAIIDLNGTTDYVEMQAINGGGTTLGGTATYTYFTGSLLASGNGIVSGSTTPGGVSGSIQFNGNGTFAGRSNLVVDANGQVGIGTNSPNTSLTVVGRVSATTVQVGRDSVACASGDIGALRLNPANGRLQVCRQ